MLEKSKVKDTETFILNIKNLSVAYGTNTAVDNISLSIKRGEIFGLLGPNGAGKTSTLSAIEGLVKPQSGSMLLEGVDMQTHPTEAKAKMGVQLQSTSFQSELTINQIVKLYAGLYSVICPITKYLNRSDRSDWRLR